MKIGIIGGGYSGLVAAYRLLKSGNEVTIYEKEDYLGGLASGFVFEGETLEKLYHHVFKTDKDYINLLKELGIEDKLKWHDSSIATYYNGNLYPFMTPVDLLLFTPLSFVNRVRAGLVALYHKIDKKWEKHQKVSAYDWMKKWGGKEVTKVIWEPLLRGKFDEHFDKVSMAWLWARIHVRANSKEKGETKEKLGYMDGGFDAFVKKLEEKIQKNGGVVKTSTEILGVSSAGDGVSVTTSKGSEKFDKVVFTGSTNAFSKLVEDRKYAKELSSINYIGSVCLVFSSKQDLSKYYWHNINDSKLPFLVFINHTKLINDDRYSGKNIYYLGSYVSHNHEYFKMREKELISKWFKGLKKIAPDFDEKLVENTKLFKFRDTQHIVDLDYANKIPALKTPLNNVYLSNFSQIYPEDRGVNYAVKAGNEIADLIEKEL